MIDSFNVINAVITATIVIIAIFNAIILIIILITSSIAFADTRIFNIIITTLMIIINMLLVSLPISEYVF